MSIERSTVSALKWAAASKFTVQAIHWAATLMVIRILVPEDYGLMAIVGVVTSITSMLAEMGLSASLVSKQTLEKGEARRVAGLMTVIHSALAAVVASTAPLIGYLMGDSRLTALIAASAVPLVINGLSAAPAALLTKDMNFRRLTMIDVTSGILSSVTTLGLALSGFGVWSLVLGTMSAVCLRFAMFATSERWVTPLFDFRGVGQHVRYGVALATSRIGWSLVNQADVIIGAKFLGTAALGSYSVAMHLATLPMQKISSVINQVALPAISQIQNDGPRLRTNLRYACRMLSIVTIPALWGISCVSIELVEAVLGEKWVSAGPLVQLASLVVPLRMLTAILRTALAAVGRSDAELWNTVTIALVWPTCFLIGSHWGALGLAASWVAAIPISFVISFRRMRAILGITYRDLLAAVRGPLVAGIAMYFVVTSIRSQLHDLSVELRLASLIAIGAGTFVVTLALADRTAIEDCRRLLALARGRR